MHRLLFAATIATVALTSTAATAWTRLLGEADFRAQIVGKQTWVDGRGGTIAHADGSVTGTWDGQAIRGRWQWSNGMYCRNLIIGTHETGTDCQQYFIRGNEARSLGNQGRGAEVIATIR